MRLILANHPLAKLVQVPEVATQKERSALLVLARRLSRRNNMIPEI